MPAKIKSPKRVYRSKDNKILCGVSGGLGEYFDIDPVIFRIIFVLLTVFGGSGILIYIILCVLMPSEENLHLKYDENIRKNAKEMKEKAKSLADDFGMSPRDSSRNWFGIIILILGILFLFGNFGFLRFNLFWPLVLIILGIWLLVKEN